jgi:aconitate hydratase
MALNATSRSPAGLESALRSMASPAGPVRFYSLGALADDGAPIEALPYSIRILLENALRHFDGRDVTMEHVEALAGWDGRPRGTERVVFAPARVLLEDLTGVPVLADLAALRGAVARLGHDSRVVRSRLPVDLVVDHGIQVDEFGSNSALRRNMAIELMRNQERYRFLKWGATVLENFRIVPPGRGIMHLVNLECLAQGVMIQDGVVFPDTLVGTDSHTTMANALGMLGWGVGGLEAEGALLGFPIRLALPEVVGVRLDNALTEEGTATDLALAMTRLLRRAGVVGSFVEFFGEGCASLPLADRATVSNMAPEYGATMALFPIDGETLAFMRLTGRPRELCELVERYAKEQALFREPGARTPRYSRVLACDLAAIEPSISGPRRPAQAHPLSEAKRRWRTELHRSATSGGYGVPRQRGSAGHAEGGLTHGSVVIAAITSCTNASNPRLMLSAGLLAQKAVERGLATPKHVKTSLAPASPAVTAYLDRAGVSPYLERLGFHTVGYGCTTCIGNSGPLDDAIVHQVEADDLVVAAVLSGNRNFEARISPHVRAAFLASPALVVAYALAGTVDVDLTRESLGRDTSGTEVRLRDLLPARSEIAAAEQRCVEPALYRSRRRSLLDAPAGWQALDAPRSLEFDWDPRSTYLREPPFLAGIAPHRPPVEDLRDARVLVMLGDGISTDHISPSGAIPSDSPAASYLAEHGVGRTAFNTYGARRGNHEVMIRGTFANIRVRNELVPERSGGWTRHEPSGDVMTVFEASERYRSAGTPLIVLAGKEYGCGSSRDWAAKGSRLLGVRAVLAESFERIHRSNLVHVGILPLQFVPGEGRRSLGLTGRELYSVAGLDSQLGRGRLLTVRADDREFEVLCRLDSEAELELYREGGMLPAALRHLLGTA